MKARSASEAVWPALQRTGRLLFSPFHIETFLKMAGVAAISEGVWVSLRFAATNPIEIDPRSIDASRLVAPEFISFTVLGVLVALFVLFFCYYLVIHLRFAFFHCVVYGTRSVREVWGQYQAAAWRFYKASLVLWLTLGAIAALIVGAVAGGAFALFNLRTSEGKLDAGVFLMLFFPCVGLILLACLGAVMAQVAMHDFILPHMAVENLSFGDAWREARRRIAADRGTFFSYFILRVGLPLLAGFLLAVMGWMVGSLAFGLLGMSGQGFEAMLDEATGVGGYLRIGLEVLFALMGLGLGCCLSFTLGGPLAAWMRAYAVEFYGSRYKLLGDLLLATSPASQE